ncbi:MAG: SMC-Scp complex subunit ScpB [Pseudomonadota bacterium]
MDASAIKNVIEAAMLAAGRPLTVDDMHRLFKWGNRPDKKLIREALALLHEDYDGRGIELKEVASGFRIQVRTEFGEYLDSLWEERSPRYSRALFETLALVAYRQPITRGEIEDVRGVAVSANIIRTLLEREWIRVIGHRDVPGKPEMFGTTKQFLDYFNLKRLDDLPELSELTDIEGLKIQLDLPEVEGKRVESLGETGETTADTADIADTAEAAARAEEPADAAVDAPDNVVKLPQAANQEH